MVREITAGVKLTSLGGAVEITNEEHSITLPLTQVVHTVDNVLFVQRGDVLARRIRISGLSSGTGRSTSRTV